MDGQGVDPYTFHGGARVTAGGGGKWIVQKFKELPKEARDNRLALPEKGQRRRRGAP